MPTIYISDSGDDKNDGLSLKSPIYSLNQPRRNCRAIRTITAGTSGREHGSGLKRSFPRRRSARCRVTVSQLAWREWRK